MGVKGANFDARNFSVVELEVLDKMQSKTHFDKFCEIVRSCSKPTI